jgi:hypothetical protein
MWSIQGERRPWVGQAAIFSSRVAGENIGPSEKPPPTHVVGAIVTGSPQIGHSALDPDLVGSGRHIADQSRRSQSMASALPEARRFEPGSA